LPQRAEPLSRSYLEGSIDPPLELAQFCLEPECALEEVDARLVELPARAQLLSVLRDGHVYTVESAGLLRAGDAVTLVGPESEIDHLAEWFSRGTGTRAPRMREFYGEFTLDGAARIEEVLSLYGGGAPIDPALRGQTIDEAIRSRLPISPVEGDAVEIAGLRFKVRTVEGSRIMKAGIALPRVTRLHGQR
jgi:cell volume regulation protein A